MSIPDFQSLMLPLLEAIGDGKNHANSEIAKGLAQRFELTSQLGSGASHRPHFRIRRGMPASLYFMSPPRCMALNYLHYNGETYGHQREIIEYFCAGLPQTQFRPVIRFLVFRSGWPSQRLIGTQTTCSPSQRAIAGYFDTQMYDG